MWLQTQIDQSIPMLMTLFSSGVVEAFRAYHIQPVLFSRRSEFAGELAA